VITTDPNRSHAEAAISGISAPGFEGVREAFARGFAEHGEVGASLCVTHRGAVVVDLVGGLADADSGRPWERDTTAMVWSSTKGVTAICAHWLVAQGELELDAPVSRWWPEFAREDKRGITVAMLLNHQAGLPGVREPLPPGAVFDFDAMAQRLAAERPFWEPGTRHGYHSFTFGWLVGEVIRRAAGMPVGELLRRHVAEPLGADVWIGLPLELHERVATTIYAPQVLGTAASPYRAALARGEELQVAVDRSWGEFRAEGACELPAARSASLPAVNGIANARGLALVYRPLALGEPIGGVRIPLARLSAVESASSRDAMTLEPTRFTSGFQKPATPSRDALIRYPESAFGHTGHGGSFGFADPAAELSAGYVMNRHIVDSAARSQALIDATYAALRGASLQE
jgi:CubicO group peptidase (beta-lactamase class C family)